MRRCSYRPVILVLLLLLLAVQAAAQVKIRRFPSAFDGGPALAGAESTLPVLSADGRYCAFVSNAQNWISEPAGGDQAYIKDLKSGAVELVSRRSKNGPIGNGSIAHLAVSADGRFVAFVSYADNLTDFDLNGTPDVFVWDRQQGAVECVSVSQSGLPGPGWSYGEVAISADGRFVAFVSDTNDLAGEGANSQRDVFVRDRQTGTTECVSAGPPTPGAYSGVEYGLSLSADGRFVAFTSSASNLVPGDTNGKPDVFVYDRTTHTTERVSLGKQGEQADLEASDPAISADGRFVAFRTGRGAMPGLGASNSDSIFVRDRVLQTTERINYDESGEPRGSCISPAISADGRFVTFAASGLLLLYPGARIQAYIRDRKTGGLDVVSQSSGNDLANVDLPRFGRLSLSGDGQKVAFSTAADNLVSDDRNGKSDTFVRDRSTGTTQRTSVGPAGEVGAAAPESGQVSLSGDGRFAAFVSDAYNLVPGDTNACDDVFVWNGDTGAVERVSVSSSGEQGNAGVASHPVFRPIPALSGDGRFVTFASLASNLVPDDTNHQRDFFVRDRQRGTTERVNLTSGGEQARWGSEDEGSPAITADGRYVAFYSFAPNLSGSEWDYSGAVFLRDRQAGTTTRLTPPPEPNSYSRTGPFERGEAPAITPDGRMVAFTSWDANLVPSDTNNAPDVFLKDLSTGAFERISVASDGTQANNGSYRPSLSADGARVAFETGATNLDPATPGGELTAVMVRDRASRQTFRASIGPPTSPILGLASEPSLSGDGKAVLFHALNGPIGGLHTRWDVYRRDLAAGTTEIISYARTGDGSSRAHGGFLEGHIGQSADGVFIAFGSVVDGIVPDDANQAQDLFRLRRYGGPPEPPTRFGGWTQGKSILLLWDDVSDDETGFEIERTEPGSPTPARFTVPAGTTSYQDENLGFRKTYTYRIRAYNADGTSEYSPAVEVSTSSGPPAAPAGLTARLTGPVQVELRWRDTSDNEQSFEVYQGDTDESAFVVTTVPANQTTAQVDFLQPNTAYRFRVRAVNADGGTFSDPVGITTGDPGGVLDTFGRLDFGKVARGRSGKQQLLIWNRSGLGTLRLTLQAPPAPFRIVRGGGSRTIPPLQQRSILIEFRPTKRGPVTVRLVLTTNDPNRRRFEVVLRGTGG